MTSTCTSLANPWFNGSWASPDTLTTEHQRTTSIIVFIDFPIIKFLRMSIIFSDQTTLLTSFNSWSCQLQHSLIFFVHRIACNVPFVSRPLSCTGCTLPSVCLLFVASRVARVVVCEQSALHDVGWLSCGAVIDVISVRCSSRFLFYAWTIVVCPLDIHPNEMWEVNDVRSQKNC